MVRMKHLGILLLLPLFIALSSCAPIDVPDAGSVSVPPTKKPTDKFQGINETSSPITRVRLGGDMLVPQVVDEDVLPKDQVGPFELRGENLASALQLILDDYDVSIAFESNAAFERQVTVSNLKGDLDGVVDRVCGLADLYCHFDKGNLTVKETETFVVDLPPIGNMAASDENTNSTDAYGQIAAGLQAIIGTAPTIDESTRIMIYTATQRTNKAAKQYFERLRKNTALIVFETHIWEVTLDNDNRTGIEWNMLFEKTGGNWTAGLKTVGSVGEDFSPVTFTPGYTGSGNFSSDAVLQFIASRGAVKTISQPQITMLSGSKATLTVTQEENFVSGITRSEDSNGDQSVSTTTETVETGLTLKIKSAWDQATVYGGLDIALDDLLKIEQFQPDADTTIQLPQTTKRGLQTEIRVKPGDSILIGGLVSEKDSNQESGPGFMRPLIPTSRATTKTSTELVFLLRPRVVMFDMGDDPDKDTAQVVNSSRGGTAVAPVNLENLTDKVQEIFKEKETPLEDMTGSLGRMLGIKQKTKVESVKVESPMVESALETKASPAPLATVKQKAVEKPVVTKVEPVAEAEPQPANKIEKPTFPVSIDEEESLAKPIKLYGEPVADPKELLLKNEIKVEKKKEEVKEKVETVPAPSNSTGSVGDYN